MDKKIRVVSEASLYGTKLLLKFDAGPQGLMQLVHKIELRDVEDQTRGLQGVVGCGKAHQLQHLNVHA